MSNGPLGGKLPRLGSAGLLLKLNTKKLSVLKRALHNLQ